MEIMHFRIARFGGCFIKNSLCSCSVCNAQSMAVHLAVFVVHGPSALVFKFICFYLVSCICFLLQLI